MYVKVLLSTKVEEPNIILSRCAGTVCRTSHSKRNLLNKGLRSLCELRLFRRRGQAFVAQLVQLIRPETPLPQTEALRVLFGSQTHLRTSLEQATNWVARPDVLVAVADIFAPSENRDKIPELEQALARDNFHLFAGVQGATMLDTATSAHGRIYILYIYIYIYICIIIHTHTHTYMLVSF